MSDNRVATIVKEIKYWKEHKLLPEQYCDFLLALYTNGDDETKIEKEKENNFNIIFQIIILVVLLPFTFLVIYFTKFPELLQLAMIILFVSYSVWCYTYLKYHTKILYHLALIISLFLVMLLSIFLGNMISNNNSFTYGIILLNFTFWFIVSSRSHINYLKFTSIIGVLFSFLYIIL